MESYNFHLSENPKRRQCLWHWRNFGKNHKKIKYSSYEFAYHVLLVPVYEWKSSFFVCSNHQSRRWVKQENMIVGLRIMLTINLVIAMMDFTNMVEVDTKAGEVTTSPLTTVPLTQQFGKCTTLWLGYSLQLWMFSVCGHCLCAMLYSSTLTYPKQW